MNDDITLPLQKLDAYRVARELAVCVCKAGIRDAELRDQATRAVKSCFLQLAEGLPRDSKPMRRKFFASASGSLHETLAAVDLAQALGAVGEAESRAAHALGVRLKRMIGALLR